MLELSINKYAVDVCMVEYVCNIIRLQTVVDGDIGRGRTANREYGFEEGRGVRS